MNIFELDIQGNELDARWVACRNSLGVYEDGRVIGGRVRVNRNDASTAAWIEAEIVWTLGLRRPGLRRKVEYPYRREVFWLDT